PQPLFYYKPPALRPLLACSIFPPCAAHTTTRRPAAAAPRRPGSRAHQSGPPRLVSPAPLPQVYCPFRKLKLSPPKPHRPPVVLESGERWIVTMWLALSAE
ncbi:hypothetical protein ACJX0J_033948, partial [Zea mays]